MSEPTAVTEPEVITKPSLATKSVLPTTSAKPTPTPEPAAPSASDAPKKPEAKTEAEPLVDLSTKPGATEIDSVNSIEDAIAVKLGEKRVRDKTPEADADPDLEKEIAETTKNLSREQQEAFKKKTYELRDAKRKVKEVETLAAEKTALEQKIKDLELLAANNKTNATPDEATTAKLAKYEQELAAVKLEATDMFRKEIGEPLEAAIALAVAAAKNAEIDEADVLAALRDTSDQRQKKLNELLANMTEFDKIGFVEASRTIQALEAKKAQMLSSAKDTLSAQTERSRQAAELEAAKVRAAREAAQPERWAAIQAMAPDLKPVEGNTEWNTALAEAEKFASYSFEDFEIQSQVEVMQRAGAFPLMAGMVAHLREQNASLEAALSKYRGAAPAAGGGDATPPVTTDGPTGESFEQRIERRLKERGAA